VHAIGKLQKRFPVAFPKKPEPKLPLKIGILEDLLPHAQELALNEAEIREAIATWCRGSRYWACLVEGAARVDLNGQPAGQVSSRDTAFARSLQRGGPRRPRHAEGAAQPSDKPQEQTAAGDTPAAESAQGAENAQVAESAPAAENAQIAESTPAGEAVQAVEPAQAAVHSQTSENAQAAQAVSPSADANEAAPQPAPENETSSAATKAATE
jgi:ProP effector